MDLIGFIVFHFVFTAMQMKKYLRNMNHPMFEFYAGILDLIFILASFVYQFSRRDAMRMLRMGALSLK